MIPLGANRYGEAQLRDPFCGGCGNLAGTVSWNHEVEATLRFVVPKHVGALGDAKPRVYRDPVEEVLDHLQCDGETWKVEVKVRCAACKRVWSSLVTGVLADEVPDEGEDDDDKVLGIPRELLPEPDEAISCEIRPVGVRELDNELLTDMLGLVADSIPGCRVVGDVDFEIEGLPTCAEMDMWTPKDRQAVVEWAGALHLRASDNDDVEVPPLPMVLEHRCSGPNCQRPSCWCRGRGPRTSK